MCRREMRGYSLQRLLGSIVMEKVSGTVSNKVDEGIWDSVYRKDILAGGAYESLKEMVDEK